MTEELSNMEKKHKTRRGRIRSMKSQVDEEGAGNKPETYQGRVESLIAALLLSVQTLTKSHPTSNSGGGQGKKSHSIPGDEDIGKWCLHDIDCTMLAYFKTVVGRQNALLWLLSSIECVAPLMKCHLWISSCSDKDILHNDQALQWVWGFFAEEGETMLEGHLVAHVYEKLKGDKQCLELNKVFTTFDLK